MGDIMETNEFTNVHAIVKKVFSKMHVYYLSDINGFVYIADKSFCQDQFHTIVEDTSEYIIVLQNYLGDFETRLKYYKSKEFAKKALNGTIYGM
jgi:hypothetical protein